MYVIFLDRAYWLENRIGEKKVESRTKSEQLSTFSGFNGVVDWPR